MARKYSKSAEEKVHKALHEMEHGELESGSSGKKVTSRKQAIAIGLSEARAAGEKVPEQKSTGKKSAGSSKKAVAKKTAAKKGTAPKKTAGKKTATKKSS